MSRDEQVAAQDRLQASLDEVSLGGNHPIQVVVPRAEVREVLAEVERLRREVALYRQMLEEPS